ncbi:MAG: FG-GAP repeat protein [gamma proteobacterium symbiont of Bathyaustriella thionipta]|nr:FG-GAP repeat protein [gamma proteobacterium symbiont of Bathyaustriella thionipta]
MPQGLGQAMEKSLHRIEANSTQAGQYSSRNPKQGLQLKFNAQGLQVKPLAGKSDWHWQMELQSWGSSAQQQPLSLNHIEKNLNRITYQRGKVSEWYVNGYKGLEQGFTIAAPPAKKSEYIELRFNLKTDLQARWKDEAQALAFYTTQGEYAFSYDRLKAWDVNGKTVPARMQLTDNVLALQLNTSHARYPLSIDPLVSTESKLTASDEGVGDFFGFSVAISGNTALIGAYGNNDAGSDSGSAYVFIRDGNNWTEQQKLVASDAGFSHRFGQAVALQGNSALIGAPLDNHAGAGAGSAYVFVRSGSTWTQQQKLTASDAASNDSFGAAVSLSGDTAVIGARSDDHDGRFGSGSAYVFVRSGSTWTQQQKLTASDAQGGDNFGVSVSIYANSILIGSNFDDDDGSLSGSAYVFVRSGTSWTQQQKLTASDASTRDRFGSAVSISEDSALIGANIDTAVAFQSGSAYVFTRTGSLWTEQQKLTASDGGDRDAFGSSVTLLDRTALVGATLNHAERGAGYIFVRNGSTWIQQQKLVGNDTDPSDRFGSSVALSGDAALAGAPWNNAVGTKSGAAYAYHYPCGMGKGLQANRWTMIGMPCGGAGTVQDVFSNNQNNNNS